VANVGSGDDHIRNHFIVWDALILKWVMPGISRCYWRVVCLQQFVSCGYMYLVIICVLHGPWLSVVTPQSSCMRSIFCIYTSFFQWTWHFQQQQTSFCKIKFWAQKVLTDGQTIQKSVNRKKRVLSNLILSSWLLNDTVRLKQLSIVCVTQPVTWYFTDDILHMFVCILPLNCAKQQVCSFHVFRQFCFVSFLECFCCKIRNTNASKQTGIFWCTPYWWI